MNREMTRTNISGESQARPDGKVRDMGNFGRRELAPEEIIRLVKERFRICDYLSRALGFWLLGAAVIAAGFQITEPDSSRNYGPTVLFVMILIGSAMSACILAVKFALYRCPVCDRSLIRSREDKFHCPRCGAQVKESV
jgi:hypothetical protein